MKALDGERNEYAKRADRLDIHAIASDTTEDLRTYRVEDGRQDNDDRHDREDGYVVGGLRSVLNQMFIKSVT